MTMINHRVRTVTALDLRIGDVVIPDTGPHRTVTLHRIEGANPRVAVQYAGIPGHTAYYPPAMPMLIRDRPVGAPRPAPPPVSVVSVVSLGVAR